MPVDRPVTIQFDHAMATGMEAYADVHESDLAGPPLEGAWTWSGDRTRLTFTPVEPWKPATVHIVHLGGGMMDASGTPVDFEEHGGHMGGEWATGDMMDGWSGGPGLGGGMGGPGMGIGDGTPYPGHMGEGWEHAKRLLRDGVRFPHGRLSPVDPEERDAPRDREPREQPVDVEA